MTEAVVPSSRGVESFAHGRTWHDSTLLFVGLIGLIGLGALAALAPIQKFPISPWNPVLGACVAIALIHRARGILLAFAATAASCLIVMDDSAAPAFAIVEGSIAAALTATITDLARRLSRRSAHFLLKNRLVCVLLVAPIAVAAAGFIYVAALTGFGIIPGSQTGLQFARFWIGGVVGVVIFAPILASQSIPGPRISFNFPRHLEAIAQGAIIVATVWIAFGEYPQTASRYLFVVFLPMIWIVLRFGVRGATAMSALIQATMIGSLVLADHPEVNFTLFQALTLVVSTSAFIFGLAVDQSKAATLQLRVREEELSASLRTAATGELAGTLAHELGHPLGAISNYASALSHILRRVAPENTEAAAIGTKLTQEVVRATDTLHRMRDFFRTGTLSVEHVDIGSIVKEAVQLLKDRLGHNAISPYILIQGGSTAVLGDRVQLRAVIYNLLVNAIDALKPIPPEARALSVTVRRSEESVILEVEDSGPGVATDVRDDIFEPLITTKKDGLGLGLSMSRSVIHAHGGIITLADSRLGGARFIVTLAAEG